MKALATDKNTGIVGDTLDLRRRRNIFGNNAKTLPKLPNVMDSVK
jgi:hypothetical protein